MLNLSFNYRFCFKTRTIMAKYLNSPVLRNFSKKRRKVRAPRPEIQGLRKSVYQENHQTATIDEEVYVGPSWIICPKDIHNADETRNSSHNWIKQELQLSFTTNFPQHTSSAHRGK